MSILHEKDVSIQDIPEQESLVNEYDRIVFEDLQIQNMVKNHHLAKSISDAGWYQLINFTKTKAEYARKIVELVNPRNTSQNCSGCHNPVPKDLSMRIHSCPFCGLVLVGTTGINACQGLLNRESMQQDAQWL